MHSQVAWCKEKNTKLYVQSEFLLDFSWNPWYQKSSCPYLLKAVQEIRCPCHKTCFLIQVITWTNQRSSATRWSPSCSCDINQLRKHSEITRFCCGLTSFNKEQRLHNAKVTFHILCWVQMRWNFWKCLAGFSLSLSLCLSQKKGYGNRHQKMSRWNIQFSKAFSVPSPLYEHWCLKTETVFSNCLTTRLAASLRKNQDNEYLGKCT